MCGCRTLAKRGSVINVIYERGRLHSEIRERLEKTVLSGFGQPLDEYPSAYKSEACVACSSQTEISAITGYILG